MRDPVKVKPLEWRDDEPFFQGEPDSVFRSEANGAGYGYVAEVVVGTPGELDREKAKSETIYTARILAALDLTGIEALQAEIKRLKEALEQIAGMGFDQPAAGPDLTEEQWMRRRAAEMQRIARAALKEADNARLVEAEDGA